MQTLNKTEHIELINNLIVKLFRFAETDKETEEKLNEFISQRKGEIKSINDYNNAVFSFIFEYDLHGGKTPADIFLENEDLSDEEKAAAENMRGSIVSVFEIKKVSKEGFELYNLVNEKTYNVLTLAKNVNFRGVISGQYLAGRIFDNDGTYYLIGINNLLASSAKSDVYKYAVITQLNNNELLYKDNDEKKAEIAKTVKDIGKKFKKFFGEKEIIVSSKNVDEILGYFNDYVENEVFEKPDNYDELIKKPDGYEYFEVEEFTRSNVDPVEILGRSFSAHEKAYDTGIIFDNDSGLLVMPFYGTFQQIFSSQDYKSVPNYKDCITTYLESAGIPAGVILSVYNENKDIFLKVVKEALELEKELTIDELLEKYKGGNKDAKKYSALTIMYCSKAFNEFMKLTDSSKTAQKAAAMKIGRNDPCPCGSGKKYKKCCLTN